ncbi:MAG: hypothetical protein ACI8Y4_002986 [Candidatus Poriferisodalaceae bacterium]
MVFISRKASPIMAKQRSSFAKLQRDRAKAAKRAEKAANRNNNTTIPEAISTDVDVEVEEVDAKPVHKLFEGKGELSAPQLLQMIEEVHRARDRGELTEDEFEDVKVEIFARLPVD